MASKFIKYTNKPHLIAIMRDFGLRRLWDDRREYSIDDLMHNLELSRDDAAELFSAVQRYIAE